MITLTEKIVDEQNGTPLTYATISIKGKGIGTISNVDGEFEFLHPNHSKDTLQISMLGYAMSSNVINAIESDKAIVFKLKKSPVRLKEVVVIANSLSANEIFRKTFENLEKTFDRKLFIERILKQATNTENGKNVFS